MSEADGPDEARAALAPRGRAAGSIWQPTRVRDGSVALVLATEDGAPAPAEGGSDARQGVVLLVRHLVR